MTTNDAVKRGHEAMIYMMKLVDGDGGENEERMYDR